MKSLRICRDGMKGGEHEDEGKGAYSCIHSGVLLGRMTSLCFLCAAHSGFSTTFGYSTYTTTVAVRFTSRKTRNRRKVPKFLRLAVEVREVLESTCNTTDPRTEELVQRDSPEGRADKRQRVGSHCNTTMMPGRLERKPRAVKKRKAVFVAAGAIAVSVVLASRGVIVSLFKLLETASPSSSSGIAAIFAPSLNISVASAVRSATAPEMRSGSGTSSNGSLSHEPDQTDLPSTRPIVDDAGGMTRNEQAPDGRRKEDVAKVGIQNEIQRLPVVERSLAFGTGQFGFGFRNSAMSFTWFVMYASEHNYTSIVVESLNWEDLFGKGQYPWAFAPHSLLFDVDHWNTFYPQLPRLISVNATLGSTIPVDKHGSYPDGYNGYTSYSTRVASDPVRFPKSPVEIAMLRGAFRPCRQIRDHMDKLTGGSPYGALHARIEPDMQKHTYCTHLKVRRLSDIIGFVEAHLPNPGFDRLFIATNRPLLEAEVSKFNPDNVIAADNLRELNRIRDEGMWNGTVAVFEAGSSYMRSSDVYGSYFGIAGAVMDYFLALQASVFIGTEVSSFSTDVIQSRFYRSEFRNYHYRPDGLRLAVAEGETQPPRFAC